MKNITLALLALGFASGSALAQDVVRMGTEGAYPPYNFINDNGEIDGFERELGDELCARADLTCEWVTNDWDSIIPNLVSGNYDTIIAGMSITPERDDVIDFTIPYTQPDPSGVVALTEGLTLSEAVIAAQTGTIQAGYVAEIGATLVEFASPDETVSAVRNGEVDAVIADKAFLVPIVAEDPDLMFVGDDILLGGGMGLGIRESDPELKATFDAAIQSMKEDGTLNALIAKWLPASAPF